MREIDRRGRDVNASIPADVIEAIDKGRNPEICTYQMLYVVIQLTFHVFAFLLVIFHSAHYFADSLGPFSMHFLNTSVGNLVQKQAVLCVESYLWLKSFGKQYAHVLGNYL